MTRSKRHIKLSFIHIKGRMPQRNEIVKSRMHLLWTHLPNKSRQSIRKLPSRWIFTSCYNWESSLVAPHHRNRSQRPKRTPPASQSHARLFTVHAFAAATLSFVSAWYLSAFPIYTSSFADGSFLIVPTPRTFCLRLLPHIRLIGKQLSSRFLFEIDLLALSLAASHW